MKDSLNKFVREDLSTELEYAKTAARETWQKPLRTAEVVKEKSVAFKEASATTQMTILGGVSAGLTMLLQGVNKMQKGLTRNEEGKREWGAAAVGAAEVAAGGFLTVTFYERLKLQDAGCKTGVEPGGL